MPAIKVIIVGDTTVGKTCIVSRIVNNDFKSEFNTIGVANSSVTLQTESGDMVFNIWDTAGQERYRSLAPMYFSGAAIAFLVFDISKKQSFEALHYFNELIKTKAPSDIKVILVGNKSDLAIQREVSVQEAELYANEIGAEFYIETSAKTGDKVRDLFIKAGDVKDLRFENDAFNFATELNNNTVNEAHQNQQQKCC